MRITMVTGVRHNEQPGDLEAGEGAHMTVWIQWEHVGLSKCDIINVCGNVCKC